MSENTPQKKWYYGVPAVAAWLLLLGPFAFPFLWKSPSFNLFWKIALTILVTALTVYMLLGTMKIVEYVLREIRQIQTVTS